MLVALQGARNRVASGAKRVLELLGGTNDEDSRAGHGGV